MKRNASTVERCARISIIVVLLSLFGLEMLYTFGKVERWMLWITDVGLAVVFCATIAQWIANRCMPRTPVNKFLALILFISLFGKVIGGGSWLQWLLGMRQSLKFVIVFYALLTFEFEESFIRFTLKLLLFLAIVCSPLAFWERYYLNFEEDIAGGLLLGGSFAVFGMAIVCLASAACIKFGWLSYEFAVILSVYLTFMIAEAKAAFIVVPVVLAVQSWPEIFARHVKAIIKLILVFTLIYAGCFKFVKYFSANMASDLPKIFHVNIFWANVTNFQPVLPDPDMTDSLAEPNTIVQAQRPPRGQPMPTVAALKKKRLRLSRAKAIVFALEYLKSNPFALIFGKGPGYASNSYFEVYAGNPQLVGRSLHSVQMAKTLVEFGVEGTLLFFCLFGYLFFQAVPVVRSDSIFWQATACGFQGILCVYVICMVYNQVFDLGPVSFLVWFLAGAIELRKRALVRAT